MRASVHFCYADDASGALRSLLVHCTAKSQGLDSVPARRSLDRLRGNFPTCYWGGGDSDWLLLDAAVLTIVPHSFDHLASIISAALHSGVLVTRRRFPTDRRSYARHGG